jgi:hypothetical protein
VVHMRDRVKAYVVEVRVWFWRFAPPATYGK